MPRPRRIETAARTGESLRRSVPCCALSSRPPAHRHHHRASLSGIRKIRHVIIIMQENRSFDSYFGTYPGADGIPARNGRIHRLPARPADEAL